MRPIFVLTLICSAAVAVAVADEGMWLPGQLPELGKTLKTAGLELKADSLADLTAHPMGAVIWLGGCTASFVSEQGLVVTNHHCAYGSIQHNSTDDNNILEKGFLAGSIDEELPTAPGSRVLVTTRVEDVTDRVLEAIPENASGKARYDAIEAAEKALVAECEEQDGVRCRVSSFYGGVLYQRFTQLEIRDVRLVYAPARSVGKYGGDVDNWMWPRHTGDYSFLRAYVGPDGKPTEPSPQNVPYRPKHWLRVTGDGVDDGDFVMVAGYPGRTSRYRLADEVSHRIDWYYPKAREVFGSLLTSVERVVEQYPDAELKVAPLVAGLNNMTKNYTGMLAGFDRVDVVSAKRELEAGLVAWIAADKTRAKRGARPCCARQAASTAWPKRASSPTWRGSRATRNGICAGYAEAWSAWRAPTIGGSTGWSGETRSGCTRAFPPTSGSRCSTSGSASAPTASIRTSSTRSWMRCTPRPSSRTSTPG
jgi:hypothetical protein